MNDVEDPDGFGRDLRTRLHQGVPEQHPDVTGLEAAARSGGLRLRRCRRAGTALGALAAAALVLAVVVPTVGSHDDGVGVATDPPPTSPQTRTATPDASFPGSLGLVDVPARQLVLRLRLLLPDDADITRAELTLRDTAPGESTRRFGSARVDLDRRDDGARRGGLELLVYQAPTRPLPQDDPERLAAISCPAKDYASLTTSCSELTADAGTHVGRALSYTTNTGFVVNEVLVQAESGDWVYVADANSLDDKWGAGYTHLDGQPPLSLEELRVIAEDPVWSTPAS